MQAKVVWKLLKGVGGVPFVFTVVKPFEVLLGTFGYFEVLLGTLRYFEVFLDTLRYFWVL